MPDNYGKIDVAVEIVERLVGEGASEIDPCHVSFENRNNACHKELYEIIDIWIFREHVRQMLNSTRARFGSIRVLEFDNEEHGALGIGDHGEAADFGENSLEPELSELYTDILAERY